MATRTKRTVVNRAYRKMMPFPSYPQAIFLFALAANLACAATRAGNLAPIAHWPPGTDAASESIGVDVSGWREWNGLRLPMHPRAPRVISAFVDSKLFSQVLSDVPADLRVEISLEEREDFIGVPPLWFVVPTGRKHTIQLEAIFKRRGADSLFACDRSETATLWWHPILILAWPVYIPIWGYPYDVFRDVRYDLVRSCIQDARSAGVF